jgi:hypothetical protein
VKDFTVWVMGGSVHPEAMSRVYDVGMKRHEAQRELVFLRENSKGYKFALGLLTVCPDPSEFA